MPEEPKNKLTGMIALKQKGVVKTSAKPDGAPAVKPKELPKPSATDKLMAAKGQTKIVQAKKTESADRKPQPKAKPGEAQKVESALAGVRRVSTPKAPVSPVTKSPSPATQPARSITVAKTPKPKPTPAPRRPSEPGILTKLVVKFQVYIREEIQEIKRELAPKHLLKPFSSGLRSVKKGASYLKQRLSEDTAASKDLYAETGAKLEKLRVVDRSDLNSDIAIVVDEKKQAMQYGQAFQQIGSIRQRQGHQIRPQSPASTDVSGSQEGQVEESVLALAIPGSLPKISVPPGPDPPVETPSVQKPESADRQSGEALAIPGALPRAVPPGPDTPPKGPSGQEPARVGRSIGDALAQMGSIRDRESRQNRTRAVHGSEPDDQKPDLTTPPAALETTGQVARESLPGRAYLSSGETVSDPETLPIRQQQIPPGSPTEPEAPVPVPGREPVPVASGRASSSGQEPMVRREVSPEEMTSTPAPQLRAPSSMKKGVPRKASKTENQVRAIRSLQVIFGTITWRMAIVDPAFKPSHLYIPRMVFETNFSDPAFRNGMKAASRIAMVFGSEWKEPVFNERIVEDVLLFKFPKVPGVEEPDEKQIAGKCDKETAKRIEQFVESDEVTRLLRNTGAKLGLFVPSIEIIARIYLSLKKGGDMDPKVRLDIQRDVLFKYQKVRYPEKAARKARNIALRYFFEFLVDYGLWIYKERKANALEIKTTTETAMEGRFESLREMACNLTAERATKAALSAQVITELREQIRAAIRDLEMGVEPAAVNQGTSEEDEDEEEGKAVSVENAAVPAPAIPEA